jgi:RNase P protein component
VQVEDGKEFITMPRMIVLRKALQEASHVPSRIIQRESEPTDRATALHPLLRLQQTVGNQAVSHLIQAKLKVGQPGDRYEQEADRVADAVMRMPESQVQRQVEDEEEEEQLQTKPLGAQITPLVQRQAEGEEEEEEERIQAKGDTGRTPEVTPDLKARLNAIRGGGRPLPQSDRAFFEPRFGRDFSQVRIHTDARAAEAARALNARAFTLGRDVAFGAGQYSPGTTAGWRLLAHELAHVVQQSKNICPRIQRKSSGKITWKSPVLNRRNAAKVFYYSKALMGTPAGLATLVVNGKDIGSNYDLMSAIPQPSIDSAAKSDGSIECWFKNPVNATANTRLDIFTKPPWKFTLPTSEVAQKYPKTSQCQGKTGETVIRARDRYSQDAKLEKLVHKGEMEHNKADRNVFKRFVGKYVTNINKHLGPQKRLVIPGKATKSSACEAELRKIENRQLLTDMVIAMNKANAHIHRNNRHEVSVVGIIVNKNCSRVLIQVTPPNL